MPTLALIAVLLSAGTHATWNLFAKKAAGSRHFVWLYSLGSVVLYVPIVAWIVIEQRPHFVATQWLALTATSVLHLGYSLALQAGYRTSDLSLVYPIARGSGPLLSFIGATLLLGERPTLLSALRSLSDSCSPAAAACCARLRAHSRTGVALPAIRATHASHPLIGILPRSFPLHSSYYARETIAAICSMRGALATAPMSQTGS